MSRTPTRFVNGVTNAAKGTNLGMFPLPDPTSVFESFYDFHQYVAGDWTVTNTASHATIGLVAGAGGLISIAGGASSVTNDIGAIITNPFQFNLQVNATSSALPPTADAWFYTAIKATTALNDQIQVGITSANSALAPTDGLYFNKAAGSAAITFVVRKGSASLAASAYSTGTTTVATLADGTFKELGFHYDGKGYINVYVDEVLVCRVDVGGSTGAVVATFPQGVSLSSGFGLKAAATAPTTADMFVDFMLMAQTRPY